MGEVYRAYDSRLDREVAIKVLPESLISDAGRLQRFEQEARAAAALNHPNILAVYQMSTNPGGISYLVTELLEGETLREKLTRGPLPLRKVMDYAVQIARGLAAPHEKGIVHRDLKPENLFVTNDGRVKILDFGLAKMTQARASAVDATLTQATEPGVVMGTVGYMSPEQVRGRVADHRSDIFAFGTILYEMVAGKQTFHKPTSAETMTAILNEDPAPISQVAPTISPGLQRVVHRCLEKNPEQRFQSASDLAFALEALSDSTLTPASGTQGQHGGRSSGLRLAILAGSIVAAVVIAVLTYLWTQPAAVPRVGNYVQVTHDGRPKTLIGTEGSRLYLYQNSPDYLGMTEMSISGGEPRKLSILPSSQMLPVMLSDDGSEFLVIDGEGVPTRGALWSVPVLGGSPRRLGDMEAQDAAWSHDRKLLAYCDGNVVFLAKGDGTEPHKLIAVDKVRYVANSVFSPDGSTLRFNTYEELDSIGVLWEVSTDGKNLHRLIPPGTEPVADQCCGRWTSDERYFLFLSQSQIWALPRKGSLFHPDPKPIPLTSSPMLLSSFGSSSDGKKLFVVGRTDRGELQRYIAKSGHFEPYLQGISAEYLEFSKDGQWLAYVSYPEGTLWRSKADGSERLQLSYPPGYAMLPRWSPDGKKIIYFETTPGKPSKMFEVSPEGGSPRPLLPDDQSSQQDVNWSADGSKIVFAGSGGDLSATIRVLDLSTHELITVPGSQGLFSPRWSPDGKYLVALSAGSTRIMRYDLRTQKWSELARGTPGWLNWSKDGQYLIALDSGAQPAVLKIRLSDGKLERTVDLKNFPAAGHFGLALSMAPDDSPLLLRNAGTQDVYALDWQEP
jgi:eukaryotic-like serine/threonine-protein kinase